jgi:hypothetical protein
MRFHNIFIRYNLSRPIKHWRLQESWIDAEWDYNRNLQKYFNTFLQKLPADNNIAFTTP